MRVIITRGLLPSTSTKFPEVFSFAFAVKQLTRKISFEFCFSTYQLLSVFSKFMYLAFIAAKESNSNLNLKGKRQSIRNSFSNVL